MKIILSSKEFGSMQDVFDNITDKVNEVAKEYDEETIDHVSLIEDFKEGQYCDITTDGKEIVLDYPENIVLDILKIYEDTIKDAVPITMKLYKMKDTLQKIIKPFKTILVELGIVSFIENATSRVESFVDKWEAREATASLDE